MPIRATWVKRSSKVLHAMVVTCLDCNREDAINSEDKYWECPKCKRIWSVEELRRTRR